MTNSEIIRKSHVSILLLCCNFPRCNFVNNSYQFYRMIEFMYVE